MSVPSDPDPLVKRALWPALVLIVLACVVLNFVQHPFLGVPSDAAVSAESHLTLWLAETEASGDAAAVVRETADSLLLYGRPATVGVLPGGSSQAVVQFFSQPQPADELLAVSSETIADLAQERGSALIGDDPIRAALAQRLLARAAPVALLSREPLTIAVAPGSPLHSAEDLLRGLHEAPQSHVFAIADGGWPAGNLAALVEQAGVGGVVPYRVFPSSEEASLALTAGSADVLLAPRGAIEAELRAHTLRALGWPAAAGPVPGAWIELLAAPGTPPARVAGVRRQLLDLSRNPTWSAQLRRGGEHPALGLDRAGLSRFLPAQMARAAELERIAERIER
jgi:ABC-type amino acid transport substrate-binding protein